LGIGLFHWLTIASFSKGALRFVGGKLSKQEHSIAVKTPAGAITARRHLPGLDRRR
jgi:hypothetical protein